MSGYVEIYNVCFHTGVPELVLTVGGRRFKEVFPRNSSGYHAHAAGIWTDKPVNFEMDSACVGADLGPGCPMHLLGDRTVPAFHLSMPANLAENIRNLCTHVLVLLFLFLFGGVFMGCGYV